MATCGSAAISYYSGVQKFRVFKIRSVSSAVFVLAATFTTCFAQSPATASSSQAAYVSISVAAGSHRFAVIATNTAGQKWESTVDATVQ